MADKNVEIAKLQREIDQYIGLGPNSLIFNFDESDGQTSLHLVTLNPRHNQSFLFHVEAGHDKVDALKKMVDYVKNYKEKESSFTIQWRQVGKDVLQTSYFSAKNVQSALDKLFYDRDPNSISVYSVIMNPIT